MKMSVGIVVAILARSLGHNPIATRAEQITNTIRCIQLLQLKCQEQQPKSKHEINKPSQCMACYKQHEDYLIANGCHNHCYNIINHGGVLFRPGEQCWAHLVETTCRMEDKVLDNRGNCIECIREHFSTDTGEYTVSSNFQVMTAFFVF